RDHRTLFAAHLITSDHPEFREAAWVLLQKMAPYEVARVLDHAKRVIGKAPRILKSAVASYLRERERNPRAFDGAALRARKDLKHLYASLRLAPGARAQAILFDDRPPEDSQAALLKRLARAESGEEQAAIVLDGGIPYPIAIGAVHSVTPALLVALIESMSPQEAINNLGALKRRGAMDHPEVKALLNAKLKAATGDRRVSTMKTKRAIAAANLDEETIGILTQVTDARVSAKAEIRRPTALFVDKSGSMSAAIEVARELSALISAVVRADFHVYAFDTDAFVVDPGVRAGTRPTHGDWERAFKLIKADGGTSIGAPLAKMTRDSVYVEQIVVVTDEGENTSPFFRDAFAEYAERLGASPQVIVVTVQGAYPHFTRGLHDRGIVVRRYEFSGDYYSLPNLLPLLALPSQAELVDAIMSLPLPRRPERVA
ncbi:MAG TPA: vWA domain-containing protein, partial [Chloroflexota bacterium]|nr:vWA domain-containing protein [Chloroflexota bacterium]